MVRNFYAFIRYTSIDILAGALSQYLLVNHFLDSALPIHIPIILLLVIWIIYTLDHILDAGNLKENAIKGRYIWHQKNRSILLIMVGLCMVIVGILSLLFYSRAILLLGVILGIPVIIYLFLHQIIFKAGKQYFYKEFWIGIIYTAGFSGMPILYSWNDLLFQHWLVILGLYLLVQVNVLLYSLYERSTDEMESLMTFATRHGNEICAGIISFLLFIAFLIPIAITLSPHPDPHRFPVTVLFLVMIAILSLIRFQTEYFQEDGRYGKVADLVFILPAGVLLFL